MLITLPKETERWRIYCFNDVDVDENERRKTSIEKEQKKEEKINSKQMC
jgi:hypothetical protein